jgi:hypothetical protein
LKDTELKGQEQPDAKSVRSFSMLKDLHYAALDYGDHLALSVVRDQH